MSQWYLNSLKVPSFWFAVVFSAFPSMIGLFLVPIISVKSDRHRGKMGRRIPFLLVTTPIAALAMIGLGATPVIARWLHEAFGGGLTGGRIASLMQNEIMLAIIGFAVFWTCYEFASIAGNAVFGALVNDVVPRQVMGRFYGLFRAVSLIDGMIFNYWLMGFVPVRFSLIMTIIGSFYGIAFLWVCLRVKEGSYPPPPEREDFPGSVGRGSWRAEVKSYFKECFSHYYYVSLFLMMMIAGISFSPVNIFAIPYANSLNINMDTYGKCLALTYLISFSLSFFIGWMADKIHPLRMALISLLGYGIVMIWGSIFVTNASTFLIAWVLHGVLSGCYFTGAASLGQRLFPHGRFAQFASAALIVSCLASIFLGPLVGQVIDISGKMYRLTFVAGSVLSMIGIAVGIIVYIQFQKLGGPNNYVAPGETESK
jgi:MFS family permease